MLTESEVRLQRYKQIEKEGDTLGHVIGVRRLKPSEQTRAMSFTADVTGSDEYEGPGGKKITIPHRMPLMVAAAVCEIDGIPIAFPRNRGELDSIYDRLDEEGLAAASKAMAKLQGIGDGAEGGLDAAKN